LYYTLQYLCDSLGRPTPTHLRNGAKKSPQASFRRHPPAARICQSENMYRSRHERVSRLRRFVGARRKGEAADTPSLIAEATRLLLLPSLRDVLTEASSEPVELRLTYACACVVLAELLSQRFAPRRAQEAAAAAINRIGTWSGLDEALLTTRASAAIKQLMETHPEVHARLCGQFEDAIERSIVLRRPAQGEVMLRLTLESFEIAIQRLVLGKAEWETTPSLIRSRGLLGVVTLRPYAPEADEEPEQTPWGFFTLPRFSRLARRQARRAAGPRR
jgi:hypothetical protein